MPIPGRVDFHVLSASGSAARLQHACRLAEKAYGQSQSVHLHTGSAEVSGRLDELLWTFRQGSFIPHEVVTSGASAGAPVTIGHETAPPGAEVIINLAETVPAFPATVGRVIEIVDAIEEGRRCGRDRFRAYRERGCQPETHNIGAGP